MDGESAPSEPGSQVQVRSFRRDDPDDLAFILAQAERIATGAPAWFLPEAIVNNTRRDLTAARRQYPGRPLGFWRLNIGR